VPIEDAVAALKASAVGLYRITGTDQQLVVGQGKLRARLQSHLKAATDGVSPRGRILAQAGPLHCSWVISSDWLPHQRLELENDLIAAHLLSTDAVPAAQFVG
jgi:hypothetical protein